jgi:hypothetical protein
MSFALWLLRIDPSAKVLLRIVDTVLARLFAHLEAGAAAIFVGVRPIPHLRTSDISADLAAAFGLGVGRDLHNRPTFSPRS